MDTLSSTTPSLCLLHLMLEHLQQCCFLLAPFQSRNLRRAL